MELGREPPSGLGIGGGLEPRALLLTCQNALKGKLKRSPRPTLPANSSLAAMV